MPAVRLWWRLRSRKTKARILFYSGLVVVVTSFLVYALAMPGRSYRGPFRELDAAGQRRALDLKSDVMALVGTGEERSQRVTGSLDHAAKLVEGAFQEAGHSVVRLPYDSDGVKVVNLEATLEGRTKSGEVVVVGAHYDTAATGTERAPGADDNASGVAAMLAIARALKPAESSFARTIRFVAFVNEEPPYFWNAEMGSLVYAKACKARGDDIVAMLSLETLGYYREEAGTQKYPPVVGWFFPDKGDFVAFVGNTSSRSLVRRSIATFRGAVPFPSEGAAMPGFVTGVGWSDQWSFWQVGYPGVMVTDTAPFRNPNYHRASDRPETLDYGRLSRVVEGLTAVVKQLASD